MVVFLPLKEPLELYSLQLRLTLLSNKCSFLRESSLSSSSFLVPVNFVCSLWQNFANVWLSRDSNESLDLPISKQKEEELYAQYFEGKSQRESSWHLMHGGDKNKGG